MSLLMMLSGIRSADIDHNPKETLDILKNTVNKLS